MWILIAAVIETMAFVCALSVLATRRSQFSFVVSFDTMALVAAIYVWYAGPHPRAVVVAAMVAVYVARMNWVLVVWGRHTAVSKLDARTGLSTKVLLALLLPNAVGWVYCLPVYLAGRDVRPLGAVDGVAVGIYVLGTVFHFGGDYQKRRFKLRKGGDGALLDTGFWRLCRHPNYLGDFLVYVSFAVAGHSVWGWAAPLLNLLQYAFDAIPKNESWAAERYGPSWEGYKARTKSFLPYLF